VSALLRDNQIERATRELSLLRKQTLNTQMDQTTPMSRTNPMFKNNPMIETLAGQVLRASKNYTAALTFYRTAVQNFPQHRALIYDYADLLLQTNQAEITVKLLTEQLTRHPRDTTLYDLQARAYAMQGKAVEQHQAQAYSYAWQGNLYAAIEQLELAKQAGGSFYQRSAIESDLRELRELLGARGKP
jgi:predicted Zn-dependent protease